MQKSTVLVGLVLMLSACQPANLTKMLGLGQTTAQTQVQKTEVLEKVCVSGIWNIITWSPGKPGLTLEELRAAPSLASARRLLGDTDETVTQIKGNNAARRNWCNG
jgi:hypothetical protein